MSASGWRTTSSDKKYGVGKLKQSFSLGTL